MVWGIRTEQIEDEEGNKTDTDNRFLLNSHPQSGYSE